MEKMRVIVVGGFLGAGKTTLLAQAARHFVAQGMRVGIITNDQAAGLVDTKILEALDVAVEEVSGGCFCCRFEDLERCATRLIEPLHPDVLLSEPVGSCTDISATVLRPMKQQWSEWAQISPFSVLADPRRLCQVLDGGNSNLPDSVRYIIKKQFEEADFLVINKVDLISPEELAILKERIADAWQHIRIMEMSALENVGVDEWLHVVLKTTNGGNRIIDVDYDLYARGEAELGWLNASLSLTAREETDWDAFARDVINRIQGDLASRSAEIGHLKLLLSDGARQIAANVTSIGERVETRGSIGRSKGTSSLIINARARVEPQTLKSIFESSIADAAGNAIEFSKLSIHSFKPAYPRPQYRLDRIVV